MQFSMLSKRSSQFSTEPSKNVNAQSCVCQAARLSRRSYGHIAEVPVPPRRCWYFIACCLNGRHYFRAIYLPESETFDELR